MSFWENDSSFSFDCKPLTTEHLLKTGLWLGLIGINETPPHVALLNAGLYYSVSASKVDYGSPLERLMAIISRKSIPCIFVGVIVKSKAMTNIMETNDAISANLLQGIYKNLEPLRHNKNTCLSPIKDFFTECYSPEFANADYVYELLALAEKKGLIQECLSLCAEDKGSNNITLSKYIMAQIRNKINTLSLKPEIVHYKS